MLKMICIDPIYRLFGFIFNLVLVPRLKARIKGHFDKTGLMNTASPEILWDEAGVIFVDYDSFAHSLWRSQEFSLFRRFNNHIQSPILDLGCGDGSFSSVIFTKIEYGVDIDPEAIEQASRKNTYSNVLLANDLNKIPPSSINTIISNSVLEHVYDLEGTLQCVHRMLSDNGKFVFTVPVRNYTKHLSKYFGSKTAALVNNESTHTNMFDINDWKDLLAIHGFHPEVIHGYQDDQFTFFYILSRMVGKKGIGKFCPGFKYYILKKFKNKITKGISKSMEGITNGANIFVVASKMVENS